MLHIQKKTGLGLGIALLIRLHIPSLPNIASTLNEHASHVMTSCRYACILLMLLFRKIVELSMAQNAGEDNMTETLSRLIKENNELKRQLGEVSILNSASDTTPRMKRKGTETNRRNLKEV